MARFEATTSIDGQHAAVALAGECDLAAREDCTAALLGAVKAADTVVVDLKELTFLDSSGVHALVTAYRAANERGGRLIVVGAAGMVAHVLEITGVAGLLNPGNGGRDG
jgi:anti-anti-sigma factor